jgi:hypothetical protein
MLNNNVIWQNRSFYVGISAAGAGSLNQQMLVSLYGAGTTTLAPNQAHTGDCSGSNYWDLGVRGDQWQSGLAPNHASGFTLNPRFSVLTSTSGYPGGSPSTNISTPPPVLAQYCNGSRVPPECTVGDGCGGPKGYGVPPGIADAVTPNPVFSLNPNATVDEGNNWINVSWGPLALTNPALQGADLNYGGGPALANYALSGAIDNVPSSQAHPLTDFFGNPRPEAAGDAHFDAGAVEFAVGNNAGPTLSATVAPSPLAFGNVRVGSGASLTLTVTNTGNVDLTGGTFTFGGGAPQPFSRASVFQGGPGTCGATLGVGLSCTFVVRFTPTTATAYNRTLTVAYPGATVTGSPVTLTGTGVLPGTLSFTSATNGTLSGAGFGRTLTFTIPSPRAPVTSVVTITNTGAGPLRITAETLLINIGGLYSITGTTCSFTTPLAPGAPCTVSIRYATPAALPAAADTGLFTATNDGTGTFLGLSFLTLSAR